MYSILSFGCSEEEWMRSLFLWRFMENIQLSCGCYVCFLAWNKVHDLLMTRDGALFVPLLKRRTVFMNCDLILSLKLQYIIIFKAFKNELKLSTNCEEWVVIFCKMSCCIVLQRYLLKLTAANQLGPFHNTTPTSHSGLLAAWLIELSH